MLLYITSLVVGFPNTLKTNCDRQTEVGQIERQMQDYPLVNFFFFWGGGVGGIQVKSQIGC